MKKAKPVHVMSLGGSIMIPDRFDTQFIADFVTFIVKKIHQGNKFIIVCGGGKICRQYIEAFRNITANLKKTNVEINTSHVGISITYANASLLLQLLLALNDKKLKIYPQVFGDPTTGVDMKKYNLAIGCGYLAGRSTDYDAVVCAHAHKINTVINLSNINFVCDKDPNKFPDAKPIGKMTWKQFLGIIGTTWRSGMHYPLDPIAATFCEKKKISVIITNGSDLKNLMNILENKSFKGTLISPN